MNSPQHVDTLFLFEDGSINTVINDNHGTIYTNGTKTPAKQSSHASPAPADTDCLTAILGYLQPLDRYVNPQLTQPAADVLTQLLSASKLSGWLFSGKDPGSSFNKAKAFKLARMLRIGHFYLDRFTDRDLNQLLEKSDADTNYRKNMNKQSRTDDLIETLVKNTLRQVIKMA